MKRDKPGNPLVTVATLTAHKKSFVENMPSTDDVIEEHRNLMTRGEVIFCLRDVHRYWSTPRISYSEIEELERQNLVQRSITGICAIRLTEQGARVKNWQPLKAP
jgi:hypothetical protein